MLAVKQEEASDQPDLPASQLFSTLEAQAVDRSTHFHAHIREKSERVSEQKTSELNEDALVDSQVLDANIEDSKSQSQDLLKEQIILDTQILDAKVDDRWQ